MDILNFTLWFDELSPVLIQGRSNTAYLNLTHQADKQRFFIGIEIRVCKIDGNREVDTWFYTREHGTLQKQYDFTLPKSGRGDFSFFVGTPNDTDASSTAFEFSIPVAPSSASNLKYLLRATCKQDARLTCDSTSFVIATHHLSIPKALPDLVYNDIKGDKYLSIPVQLLGANGQMVHGREVPLKVTLRYTNGELVRPTYPEKQPILIMLLPENPRLEVDGNCVIKARIMQITRNHNNQHFMIRIEPDLSTHSENSDIGYGECGPFDVRTKPTESKRKADESSAPKETPQHTYYYKKNSKEGNNASPKNKRSRSSSEPKSSLNHCDTTTHIRCEAVDARSCSSTPLCAVSDLLNEGEDAFDFISDVMDEDDAPLEYLPEKYLEHTPDEPSFYHQAVIIRLDHWVREVEKLRWTTTREVTALNAAGEEVPTSSVIFTPPCPNDFIDALFHAYYDEGGLRDALLDFLNRS